MLTMRWMSCRMDGSEDETMGAGSESEPEMSNSQEWLVSSPAQQMRTMGNARGQRKRWQVPPRFL